MTREEHLSLHHKGKTTSEETRNKQSKKRKEKFRSGELKVSFRGEESPNSILTEQNVIQIRTYLKEGILTQREIGEKFGVDQTRISKIKNRKTWKHIE